MFNNQTSHVVTAAMALMALAVLSGCGKKSDPAAAPGAPGIGLPGTPGIGLPGAGACVPISQAIGFQIQPTMGNSVSIGGFRNQNIQIGIGGGGGQYYGFSQDGTIQMNLQNMNGGQYGGGGYSGGTYAGLFANGTLTIAAATQTDIRYKLGMYGGNYTGGYTGPYNNFPGGQFGGNFPTGQYNIGGEPCVVGIDVNLTVSAFRLYYGGVILHIASPSGQYIGPYGLVF